MVLEGKTIGGIAVGIVVGFGVGMCLPEERKPKWAKDIRNDIEQRMKRAKKEVVKTED